MDVILVPGLWLDASSWDRVVPVIESGGHRAVALTLPGMDSRDVDRSQIGLSDHVDAVVAAIDAAAERAVLVGHSMGAGIVSVAVDTRPDRVARVLYVGGFPARDGRPLDAGFAAVRGEVPMPDLSEFDEADLRDFDDAARDDLTSRAIPSPAGALHDTVHLTDPRRYEVPAVAVCPEYTSEQLREWIATGEDAVQEFA